MLKSLLIAMGACGLLLFSPQLNGQAGELIIRDGGTMVIESESTLFLNCNDITIEKGGAFTLNGGTIKERGKLIVQSGGQYTISSGSVEKCYKSFYVIPTPDGKAAVICL